MGSDAENKEATFNLNLASNAGQVGAEAAAELEQLRARIASSSDAVKQMNASLRSLRGSTDEVKDAKAQLQARVDAEKDAISAANLALLKQGLTYDKVAQSAKKLENEKKALDAKLKAESIEDAKKKTDQLGGALKAIGGPTEALSGKFETLKTVLNGGAVSGIALFTLGVGAAIGAVTELASGVAGLAASFVRFVVGGAGAARSMNLVRLATVKTEQNARNLGTQVDALAAKVATPKEELNKLAASLGRTRLSGTQIVDTFNAVGQASAAMGDEVGNQVKNLITRAQMSKRVQINPLELQGTGLKFEDIAGALSKQLGIGVKDAQAALFEGRVKLDDGAKAIRTAVEKRFAELNASKALSLDVQIEKDKERLQALTSGVNIEPLLKGFGELGHLLDASTVTGATLKTAITSLGNAIGPAFQKALPTIKQFVKGAVIGALDVGIGFLKLGKTVKGVFGDDFKAVDVVKQAELPFKMLANAVEILRVSIEGLNLAYRGLKIGVGLGSDADVNSLKKTGQMLGLNLSGGVVEGLKQGAPAATDATKELAKKVEAGFKDRLQIHSPSRVFADFGESTTEGYAEGAERGAPSAASRVEQAFAPIAGAPAAAAPARGGGAAVPASSRAGGGQVVVNLGGIHLVVSGGAGDVKAKLGSPSFLGELTKAVQDVLKGAGIPTQAVPAP